METFEQSAIEWIKTHDHKYTLERKDADRIIIFSLESDKIINLCFNLTCPEREGERWSVWSDCTEFQPELQTIMEYCDSARDKTITDVLDKIHPAVIRICSSAVNNDDESDDDDFDDGYYNDDDDIDRDEEVTTTKSAQSDSDDEDAETFFGGGASPAAFQRLSKDMKNMKKEAHNFGIIGNPRGDNLFIWDVKLTGFPSDTKLGKDLQNFAQKFNREPVVYLEMQFPGEYPMSPPFVRVTRPRFKFLTGHITIGGSICMEMLTKSGWRPTNDIEGILVQIRSEIMSDPNARLDANPDRMYTEGEAKDAFNRMVDRYGWNK